MKMLLQRLRVETLKISEDSRMSGAVECAMLLLMWGSEKKDTQQPHSTCARHCTFFKNFEVF